MKYELVVDGIYILGLDDFNLLLDFAFQMKYNAFSILRDQVEYLTFNEANYL